MLVLNLGEWLPQGGIKNEQQGDTVMKKKKMGLAGWLCPDGSQCPWPRTCPLARAFAEPQHNSISAQPP